MLTNDTFTDEQKQYLQGFIAGADLARRGQGLGAIASLPVLGAPATSSAPTGTTVTVGGPEAMHRQAQDRFIAAGKKLTAEETAKRDKNALDLWDDMAARAEKNEFPKGTDVFLTKYHGLFFVAPAQNAYMCRLRFPAGVVNSHQLRGLADMADEYAGGYSHVTTRANLQLREIGAGNAMHVLTGLQDLGILNRGAGADNIRNITASPTAGIDADELIDTRPLARQLHYHILNHRELFGLPRKFNIAFDGGGRISAVADTNDIAFFAVRVRDERKSEASRHADLSPQAGEPSVRFRMELGGITGHKDFSRDTGVLLTPQQCLPMAVAVLRVYIDHGDRTDRKKARLKYLLDAWGFDKFMAEVRKHLSFDPMRLPMEPSEPRPAVDAMAHVGVHAQKQHGMNYIGVVLPVGKLTSEQMRGLSRVAERYGSGDIRLTVWQNLLITHIADADVDSAKQAIEALGLHWSATHIRAGLIACTGNRGCKYAASDTKGHAMRIAEHLESRLALDQPINIHLTGCHHSCAQHYIGDIGLLGASVSVGEDMVEGYHVFVGGGFGEDRRIGRELMRDVPADEAPRAIERMLRAYLGHRLHPDERFRDFAHRLPVEELKTLIDHTVIEEPAAAGV